MSVDGLILPEDLPLGVTSINLSIIRSAQMDNQPVLVMQYPTGYVMLSDPRDVHRLADTLHEQADELAKVISRDYR
jgi:hypothetical protein